MITTQAYRLNITQNTNDYRLAIVGDETGKVAGSKSPTAPRIAQICAWLTAKGFEAYGEMRQVGDHTLTTMVRPID